MVNRVLTHLMTVLLSLAEATGETNRRHHSFSGGVARLCGRAMLASFDMYNLLNIFSKDSCVICTLVSECVCVCVCVCVSSSSLNSSRDRDGECLRSNVLTC